MSIRLHALGFPCAWEKVVDASLPRIVEGTAREVACESGRYRLWQSRQGAELWLHYPSPDLIDPDETAFAGTPALIGLEAITPFHRGTSDLVVRLGELLCFDDELGMEGSVVASLVTPDEKRSSGELIVELVPFALHEAADLPETTRARIVCFAHHVWAFPDRAGYIAGTPGVRLIRPGAIRSVTEDEMPEVPVAYAEPMVTSALATGRVLRSARLKNPITDAPYCWIELLTTYGPLDVIANPETIEGDISDGHLAQVFGSLVARLAGITA
jgi:hypothetical protein